MTAGYPRLIIPKRSLVTLAAPAQGARPPNIVVPNGQAWLVYSVAWQATTSPSRAHNFLCLDLIFQDASSNELWHQCSSFTGAQPKGTTIEWSWDTMNQHGANTNVYGEAWGNTPPVLTAGQSITYTPANSLSDVDPLDQIGTTLVTVDKINAPPTLTAQTLANPAPGVSTFRFTVPSNQTWTLYYLTAQYTTAASNFAGIQPEFVMTDGTNEVWRQGDASAWSANNVLYTVTFGAESTNSGSFGFSQQFGGGLISEQLYGPRYHRPWLPTMPAGYTFGIDFQHPGTSGFQCSNIVALVTVN